MKKWEKLTIISIKNFLEKHPLIVLISMMAITISTLVTLIEGGEKIHNYFLSTFRHKEMLYEKIQMLSAGVEIEYFSKILGSPIYKSIKKNYIDFVYVDPFFYVEAEVDKYGIVQSYTVTTRSSNFNPEFIDHRDNFKIYLGKTKFSEITAVPDYLNKTNNGEYWFYAELYTLWGRDIQSLVIAYSPVGYGVVGNIKKLDLNFIKKIEWHFEWHNSNSLPKDFWKFRHNTIINTYGVALLPLNLDSILISPDPYQVNTLSEKGMD